MSNVRLVVALGAILVFGGAPAKSAVSLCGLGHPEACRDTNALVWSPGFKAAVGRFVGRGHGPENAMANAGDAVVLALGGPPDVPVRLRDGGWMFSACEAHDCPIKGVLVLDKDTRIRAAGVFNFRCSRAGCADEPRLDLFLRDPTDAPTQLLLTEWAERVIADDLKLYPTVAAKRLGGVRIQRAAG